MGLWSLLGFAWRNSSPRFSFSSFPLAGQRLSSVVTWMVVVILTTLCVGEISPQCPIRKIAGIKDIEIPPETQYTDCGNLYVKGLMDFQGSTMKYLGIPFANAKRFAHSDPQPLCRAPISRPCRRFEATSFGPACLQTCPEGDVLCYGAEEQSEDCLSLNVFVPLETAEDPTANMAPVVVFFHGGAFMLGNTRGIIEGNFWAANSGTILVTANYRLGIYGWVRYGTEIPGNQGFTDQLAALQWVKKYIQYFGGNSSQIAVMGQSAGAVSVSCHLVSPHSRGLFSSAIMQSPSLGDPRKRIQASESLAHDAFCFPAVVDLCGIPPDVDELRPTYLTCLRAIDAKVLLDAAKYARDKCWQRDSFCYLHSWDFTVDGSLIPEDCTQAIAEGKHVDPSIPILMGSVNREGSLVSTSHVLSSIIGFMGMADIYFPHELPRIIDVYLPKNRNWVHMVLNWFKDNPASQNMFGDYVYTCAIRYVARSIAARNQSVYLYAETHGYEWMRFQKNNLSCAPNDLVCRGMMKYCGSEGVVCHAEELSFQFQSVPFPAMGFSSSPDEIDAVLLWYKYLSSFARNGVPEVDESRWAPYSIDSDRWQVIGKKESESIDRFRAKQCDFWDTLIPKYNVTWDQYTTPRKNIIPLLKAIIDKFLQSA